MTPKQITKFREKHFPAKNISTSQLKMAVEFRTTERTIRAYESGENISIPGVFVKAVELWLEKRDFMLEVSKLSCTEADGFEGLDTFPDCGKCVVCLSKIRIA